MTGQDFNQWIADLEQRAQEFSRVFVQGPPHELSVEEQQVIWHYNEVVARKKKLIDECCSRIERLKPYAKDRHRAAMDEATEAYQPFSENHAMLITDFKRRLHKIVMANKSEYSPEVRALVVEAARNFFGADKSNEAAYEVYCATVMKILDDVESEKGDSQ
jgi:hypothetical protein